MLNNKPTDQLSGLFFSKMPAAKGTLVKVFPPFSILALCLLIYAQGDLTFCLAAGFLSGGGRKLKSLSAEGQLDSDGSIFAKTYFSLLSIDSY